MTANEGQISVINNMSKNDTGEMLKLINKADNERAGNKNNGNGQDPARFKRAAELYRLALEACGCPMGGNHLKTTRTCNIAECVAAVQGDDLGALSALHDNPCSCGFAWSACEQPLHAETVDKLAECLEEAALYTRAIQAGFYLVRLDPASPVGHCRVAKIVARLAKAASAVGGVAGSFRQADALAAVCGLGSRADLEVLLRQVLLHGLHNVESQRRGLAGSRYHIILNMMAYRLRMTEAKRDPVGKLPAEMVNMIFANLSTGTLCTAARVSRLWHRQLMGDRSLWKKVVLARPLNPGRFFGAFMKRCTATSSLSIKNMSRFGEMSVDRLVTIFRLPALRRLHLNFQYGGKMSSYEPETLQRCLGGPGHLTHLSLLLNRDDLVADMLNINRDSLEVAEFPAVTMGEGLPFFLLRKLTKLRIWEADDISFVIADLDLMMRQNPAIQHIFVERAHFSVRGVLPGPSGYELFQPLRSIVLGPGTELDSSLSQAKLTDIPSLESIQILVDDDPKACAFMFADTPGRVPFPNLKVFRCHSPLGVELLRCIVGPAARSGRLEVLDLSVGDKSHWFRTNVQPVGICPEVDLAFTACKSLRTIGLSDFNWGENTPARFDAQPFVDWVAMHPDVDTVACYPKNPTYDAFFPTLSALFRKAPKVKVVYEESLASFQWDAAKEMADRHGVRLVRSKGGMPAIWEGLDDEF